MRRWFWILLGLLGIVLIVLSGVQATSSFSVRFNRHTYKCGTLVSPKDPRDLVGKHAQVPRRLQQAYTKCQNERSRRNHRAVAYLVAGAVPILLILTLPAFMRGTRRARGRKYGRI